MPLFEVAILEAPTRSQAKEKGAAERLVFGPKPVIAADEQTAALAAIMGEAKEIEVDKNRMLVLVRPFVDGSPSK